MIAGNKADLSDIAYLFYQSYCDDLTQYLFQQTSANMKEYATKDDYQLDIGSFYSYVLYFFLGSRFIEFNPDHLIPMLRKRVRGMVHFWMSA